MAQKDIEKIQKKAAKAEAKRKRGRRIKISRILILILVGLLVCFCAFPLIALFCRAFMPLKELYIYPPRIFFRNPTLGNFADLLTSLGSSTVPFTRYIFNSLFVTLLTVFLAIIVCSMGAYGMVKHHPVGASVIFTVVIAALGFSSHVTKIPNYMIVSGSGLMDTYWALIIPSVATAYNFFLMKQFTEQMPDALLEAARIDGAKEFRIYWTIVMPLLKPAWSTLFVLTFISSWNDSFSPLVYIQSDAMKTLPLAIQTISGGAGVVARSGTPAAAALLQTAPSIIIYLIMKGQVLQTMAYSGIKS